MFEQIIDEAYRELIGRGRYSNARPPGVSPDEYRRGIAVEMEHTKDPEIALTIALGHWKESKVYYKYLDRMEKLMPKSRQR